MTGRNEWGLIRFDGRIVGVHSMSEGKPVKRTGFPKGMDAFANATAYREWEFRAGGSDGATTDRGTLPATPGASTDATQPSGSPLPSASPSASPAVQVQPPQPGTPQPRSREPQRARTNCDGAYSEARRACFASRGDAAEYARCLGTADAALYACRAAGG